MVPDRLVAEVHAAAACELHPQFAELVQATPDPFVQVIVDVAVPRMAFGRVCLVGDAAFVVRPHTAAATAKAAADAATLADMPSPPSRAMPRPRYWHGRHAGSSMVAVLWTAASPLGNARSSGPTTWMTTAHLPARQPSVSTGSPNRCNACDDLPIGSAGPQLS